jgi:hypothetical protein
MQQSSKGHVETTDSVDAAAIVDRAVGGYAAWRNDTMDHTAIHAGRDIAVPCAASGILTIGLRKPELRAPAEALLAFFRTARILEIARERRYIAALDAAMSGRITEAVTYYEAIARARPHDLSALRLS